MKNTMYIVLMAVFLSCNGHQDENGIENDHHFYKSVDSEIVQKNDRMVFKSTAIFHSRQDCEDILPAAFMDMYTTGDADRVQFCTKCMDVELVNECNDSIGRHNR